MAPQREGHAIGGSCGCGFARPAPSDGRSLVDHVLVHDGQQRASRREEVVGEARRIFASERLGGVDEFVERLLEFIVVLVAEFNARAADVDVEEEVVQRLARNRGQLHVSQPGAPDDADQLGGAAEVGAPEDGLCPRVGGDVDKSAAGAEDDVARRVRQQQHQRLVDARGAHEQPDVGISRKIAKGARRLGDGLVVGVDEDGE
mmetsp:Transcript_31900/g.107429  ORF Transcript_31900/g.107429 Transcript_31900/m.107429 type:complete len:203 (+) Transcript_31900:39-647(+)